MDELERPEVPGYAVGRLLGQGSTSRVWLVTDDRTGRDFALKCFRPAAEQSACGAGMTEEGIRREIRILAGLDHPHLVRFHDVVGPGSGTRDKAALVMDYAPAGSLAGLVAARGRLSAGEAVTVLMPIAQALAYLHRGGLTHGDVSPGNILFTAQGKPMLSDVGIARLLGDPARPALQGTPGFLDPAPEVAAQADLQPERDVYSLAAVGWFCLTGRPPEITAERPPLTVLVPAVPAELAAALESALDEDRRLRPTAAALATAVYRSAAPLPLDLAPAVHPAVLPELVTRLHTPPRQVLGFRGKVQALLRTLATTGWFNARLVPQKLPFPPPEPAAGGRPGGKKRHRMTQGRRRVVPGILAALLGAALAGIWWIAGAGVTAAGPAVPPENRDSGTAAVPLVESSSGTGAPQGLVALARTRELAASRDPVAAVQGLASLRAAAFSTGMTDLLLEVNQPGSDAEAADQRIAAWLKETGKNLVGFSSSLSELMPEDGATVDRAVVALTSATSAYTEKNAPGDLAPVHPATPGERLRVVLVSVDGRWLVSAILPGT